MTTISIINGIIIQDGRPVVPRQCQMGLRVQNVLEYFSNNKIDMTLSGHSGLVSISVSNAMGKNKLIQALIDDKVIRPSQLMHSA